jgi:hypothetical protein
LIHSSPPHRLHHWSQIVQRSTGTLLRRVALRYGFVCALIAFIPAVFLPVARYGDASDYVMMTMSLGHDGDLVYEKTDLDRILATRPAGTDFPAGLFLIRDETGKLLVGGHSFYYSALAVPFYLVFGLRGFMVLNGFLWLCALILIQHHWTSSMGRHTSWLLALAALWFSAAYDYLLWQTPATWLLFISTGFFAAYQRNRMGLAGLCLGLAAASQFTLALFGVVPLIDLLRRSRPLSDVKKLLAMGAAGALPQVVYFVVLAGTVHITWLGLDTEARYLYLVDGFPGQVGFDRALHSLVFARFARMEHINIAGFAAALFSPKMGLVWFYPFVFLAALRMLKERRGGVLLVGALVVLAGFVTAAELDTHQVGLRYLNPIYPAFLLGFRSFSLKRGELISLMLAALLGISFVLFPRANSSARIWDKAVPTARLYP